MVSSEFGSPEEDESWMERQRSLKEKYYGKLEGHKEDRMAEKNGDMNRS